MNRLVIVVPAVTVALLLAVTGCSRLETHAHTPAPSSAVSSASGASVPSTGTPGGAPDSTGPGSLDGISQDLDSADGANAHSGSDQQSADQAAATNDAG